VAVDLREHTIFQEPSTTGRFAYLRRTQGGLFWRVSARTSAPHERPSGRVGWR